MSERKVVLVDGTRIPFLKANTSYKNLRSYDLARLALKGLLDKTQLSPHELQQVIAGTVISNFTTSNVARDALLGAGLPYTIPAFTVTMACISANQAITSGVDLIASGQKDVVIAGGTESLSDVPIRYKKKFRRKLMAAQKFTKPWQFLTFLNLKDWLPEIPRVAEFATNRTMGQDCERTVSRIGVTRREQDEYAIRSHHLAAEATEKGFLAQEISPISIEPKFQLIDKDNGFRGDSSMEKLQKLRPAFVKPHGTITAGNASFLTDGAAFVLLMEEEKARALGYEPKAIVKSYAYTAQSPHDELLLGPAYAIPKVLDQANLTLKDIDVFEIHEAFAGQVLAALKCLDSDTFAKENLGRSQKVGEIPMDKINTWGGSLSIGHPFGATGSRLVTCAANRLIHENKKFALIASCAAGALGHAMIIENCRG